MIEEHILYPKTTMFLLENFMLSEVRGRIPELDEIVEDFQRAAEKKLQAGKKDFILTQADFPHIENPFWKEIWIHVKIKPVDREEQSAFTGQFVTTNSELTSDGKLKAVRIILEGRWREGDSVSMVLDGLGADFAHEISHGYTEYARLVQKADSLDDPKFQERYGKLGWSDSEPRCLKYLKQILYFTLNVEQQAFIGELYVDAKRLVRSGMTDPDKIYKALKSEETQVGSKYIACVGEMHELSSRSFWKEQVELDKTCVQKFIKTYNDIFGTDLKTFGTGKDGSRGVWHKLVTRWNRCNKLFKSKLGKVAYDVAK